MSADKTEKIPPSPPSGGRVDFTSRYRPQIIEELVGEKLRREVANLLRFGIGKVLLSGPYGYGKSSVARLLAKSLVCFSPQPGPCGTCEACASFEAQWDKGGGWVKTREGIPRCFLALDMTEKGKDDVQILRAEIAPSFGASPPIFDTAVIVLDEIHRLARPAQELLFFVKIRAKTGNERQHPATRSPSGNGAPRENRTPISALKGRRPSR